MSEEKKIEAPEKPAIDAQDAQKILGIFSTYCKGIDYNDLGIIVEVTSKLNAIVQASGAEAVEAIKQEAIDDYLASQKAEGGMDEKTQAAVKAARGKAKDGGEGWSPSEEQQKGMAEALKKDAAKGGPRKGGKRT